MQKAAAFLKNLRQEKGISIDQVSKSTKMSPSIVRALEEGRLDGIDEVYLKGFLKLYCRFLGVDWEKFSKEYSVVPSAGSSYKIIPEDKPKIGSRKNPISWVSSLILRNRKIALVFLSFVLALFSIVLLFRGCISLGKKIKQSDFKEPAKLSPVPEQAKSNVQPTKKTHSQISTQAVSQPRKPETRPVKLGMFLKENSFVKVALDGKVVFQGVLRKGRREAWTAKDKIELSIGNAAAVELEVDGKSYSSLGRRGQAIKRIVIDRQGLRIF